jgi:hypothetical protein
LICWPYPGTETSLIGRNKFGWAQETAHSRCRFSRTRSANTGRSGSEGHRKWKPYFPRRLSGMRRCEIHRKRSRASVQTPYPFVMRSSIGQ